MRKKIGEALVRFTENADLLSAGIKDQVRAIVERGVRVSRADTDAHHPQRRRGARPAGVHAYYDTDRRVADRGRLRVTFRVTRDSPEPPDRASTA
jgi:hypothetical protein